MSSREPLYFPNHSLLVVDSTVAPLSIARFRIFLPSVYSGGRIVSV